MLYPLVPVASLIPAVSRPVAPCDAGPDPVAPRDAVPVSVASCDVDRGAIASGDDDRGSIASGDDDRGAIASGDVDRGSIASGDDVLSLANRPASIAMELANRPGANATCTTVSCPKTRPSSAPVNRTLYQADTTA